MTNLQEKHSTSPKILLCIIDGLGISKKRKNNAFALANAPTLKKLFKSKFFSTLSASEEDVGLPQHQFGNSEIGHSIIGSGQINEQKLTKITNIINSGKIKHNTNFQQMFTNSNDIHLIGLLSNGGVHSHENHLFGLINIIAPQLLVTNNCLFLHLFSDGRDVAPKSITTSLAKLEKILKQHPNVSITTLSGRYYSMDRDSRQERTQLAYNAIVHGKSNTRLPSITQFLNTTYKTIDSDEFILPTTFGNFNGIKPNDYTLFYNFRADRMRQLVSTIAKQPNAKIITMVDYFANNHQNNNITTIIQEEVLNTQQTLGSLLAQHNIPQLRVAETEKYAHITYFFNGGIEQPFPLEDRILIPSPKVPTYDQTPEMSAQKVTQCIIDNMHANKHRFIAVNFANCDMVGHTGNLQAAINAVEAVDTPIDQILQSAKKNKWYIIITADHGNVEEMQDANKIIHTQHTINKVPFIFIPHNKTHFQTATNGTLADIAPTIMQLFEIPIPPEITGKCLLK